MAEPDRHGGESMAGLAAFGVRRYHGHRPMNVLFVCTENVARSRLAETLFRELQGREARHQVRSVGTASHAARRLTTRDLAWADVVAVMEHAHFEVIQAHWPHHAKRVVVLDISDEFLPEESELRELLEPKVRALLEQVEGWEDSAASPRPED